MGSHTRVTKKLKPNLWRGSADCFHNSSISKTVISTTEAAHRNVAILAISSPSCSREINERGAMIGPALGKFVLVADTLLNFAQRLGLFGDDFRRKLRVGKGFGIVLPVGKHPLDKFLQRIAFRGVRKFTGNQEPGKTRYWISRFAGRVGDGHAKIVGHGLYGAGGRRADARQIGLDKIARSILNFSIGHLVLDCVN